MTILGNTQNTEKSSIKDTKILGTEIYVDLKDKEHTITTIKTTQNGIKISPCATMTYQPDKEDKKAEKIIIGRELLGYQPNNKWIETKENVCHYMEGIYRFQKELDELPKDGKGTEGQEIYDLKLDEYITNNYQDANKQDAFKTKITNGEFLQIYRNPLDEQFSLAGTGKSNYPIFNNS
ncbi:MAG: hypothetical protein LBD11_06760 [Candidatus Peribacteria bacterium]|jgi:hypothetical protein|nr:hypothetical protein [Candidatus Peribacteria bacterium]